MRQHSRPLPAFSAEEARLVWASQRQPSARTVAMALSQADRPVHFTAVNRWRKRGWLTVRTEQSRCSSRRRARGSRMAGNGQFLSSRGRGIDRALLLQPITHSVPHPNFKVVAGRPRRPPRSPRADQVQAAPSGDLILVSDSCRQNATIIASSNAFTLKSTTPRHNIGCVQSLFPFLVGGMRPTRSDEDANHPL
jgi:hypothetical protein